VGYDDLDHLLGNVEDIDNTFKMVAYESSHGEGGHSPRHATESAPLIKSPSILEPPPDKKYGVFFIFGFLGLASLLPWNFFITAKKYFDYKFRNTSLPPGVPFDDEEHSTEMQQEFESYLSIVSNVANLLFMIVTVLLVRSISVKVRITVSTVLVTLIFVATTVLVEVDSDSWQQTFFILTLAIATVMSGVQSVLTGSVLSLSTLFPPKYSQSAMIGQAAGGTFSAIVSILTHSGGGSPITSALIYFLIATAITLMALFSYISLHFMAFSKYFMVSQGNNVHINEEMPLSNIGGSKKEYFFSILKKTWNYSLSLVLIFMVTLSVFPAVCSLIKSTSDSNPLWTGTYFTPVICFLLFNLGDFIGRLGTFVVKYPGSERPNLLLVFSILRIAFIPLLMLCNVEPRSNLPVALYDDSFPIILITLLGLTNGYLGTLCMSFGPLDVLEEHLEGAGMVLALAMTLGLSLGSVLSILLVKVV
jgi:equilibrative nucleoside transporter 1/2/3